MATSRTEVARAFQLDRAVIHNWVKASYVPARWAAAKSSASPGPHQRARDHRRASARTRCAKSRPGERAVWHFPRTMPVRPAKRINLSIRRSARMGPGDRDPSARADHDEQPAIGYLDPIFVEMMEELKRCCATSPDETRSPSRCRGRARSAWNTASSTWSPRRGSCARTASSAAACSRTRSAAAATPWWSNKWGEPVDPQKLEDALKKNRDAKVVAFVHAETSTGCQSDAKLLTRSRTSTAALVIVDAVTSLGGSPVKVDEWEIDAIYSASQKCLSCTGLSPVSFSERVVEHVKKRKDKIHSWFMDMNLLLGYWNATTAPITTAPTNSLFALHEALLLIREEGLENSWARHLRHHVALKAGLEAMGLKFLVRTTSIAADERGGVPRRGERGRRCAARSSANSAWRSAPGSGRSRARSGASA